MHPITINHHTCIKCGKCVRICPSGIFYFSPENQEIETQHEKTCINCGHCVAVCPTDAVEHTEFPPQKVHPFDRSLFPTAEQMAMLINSRRSNRAFSSKPIPEEYLAQIMEAAYRTPTASNKQELSFTVITDPEKLKLISAYTIDWMSKMVRSLSLISPILKIVAPEVLPIISKFRGNTEQYRKGNDLILRGCRAVIFFQAPRKERFGKEDANLAYQNASLMAESLGVAQFYTGFVCSVSNKKPLMKSLGITDEIYAGMALGMPSFTFDKYIDRKPARVSWI